MIRSGCITAIFVGSLLGLMSIVTFGITGKSNSIESLGTLAKQFMPAGLWYLFIIGGAWGAMLSTMNAVILSVGYRLDTMAEDGIFPAFFNKKRIIFLTFKQVDKAALRIASQSRRVFYVNSAVGFLLSFTGRSAG